MRDVLTFLQDVDLGQYAAQLGQLITSADPWLLGIAVSALVGVGHKMAVGNRLVYGWGLRLAALTFLVHGGYAIVQAGGLDQVAMSSVVARSAILGGSVLAFIWILLPIILFVYANFRFGLAGFLGYAGYALLTVESFTAEAMPGIALRGLLVAGLAMVLAWILRPIWEFVASIWHVPVSSPVEPAKTSEKPTVEDPRLSRRERRLLRLARRRARKEMTVSAEPVPVVALTSAAVDDDSRRRRDKARLDAELAYLLALPHLGANFPRDTFDGWVLRYLSNHLPPEEVEENSWQLQKALRQYHSQADGGNGFFNLEELHFWFVDEQQRIQGLTLETAVRQEKLLALQELYISLSQRFLGDPPVAVVQMLARPRKEITVAELPEAVGAHV